MEATKIVVEGRKYSIPSCYQQADLDLGDSELGNPADSLSFTAQTGQALCFVLAYHIDDERRMPTDREAVVGAIRGFLQENQGIVEVNTGAFEGMPYIYSIVKSLAIDGFGVRYILSMDIATGEGAVHFQGQFDEIGTTGTRDTLAFELCRREGLVDFTEDGMEGWSEDPYDPEWTQGALMNLSEKPIFDKLFPEHPLSMAREFVSCVLEEGEDNMGQTQEEKASKLKLPFGGVDKLVGDVGKVAGDFVGKAADAAGDTAGKVMEAAGDAVSAAADVAGEARDAIGEKVDGMKAGKDSEPDEYDLAVIGYNLAYTDLNNAGLDLFQQRERSIDLMGHVENLVNSIANRPKSFDSDLGEVSAHKREFKEAEEFAKRELSAARKSAASASVGVAAGMAVACMAPSAALWVATTFGTASTGAAISTLSGAAASQAALAWLGGGAIAAGGGGTAAGSALLAMAGPIGWGIAGATLLTSIVLFTKARHDIKDEKQKELSSMKENTERVAEASASVRALVDKTGELRERLHVQYDQCIELFGADFSKLDMGDQDRLAAMVNNTLALSRLLNERVVQDGFVEEQGEQ